MEVGGLTEWEERFHLPTAVDPEGTLASCVHREESRGNSLSQAPPLPTNLIIRQITVGLFPVREHVYVCMCGRAQTRVHARSHTHTHTLLNKIPKGIMYPYAANHHIMCLHTHIQLKTFCYISITMIF